MRFLSLPATLLLVTILAVLGLASEQSSEEKIESFYKNSPNSQHTNNWGRFGY